MALIVDNLQVGDNPVGQWFPPCISFGGGYTSGVSVFRSSGSGLLFTFDAANDDEWSTNLVLRCNGIDYDGTNLKVRIYYQIPVSGGAGDNVKLNYDYAFLQLGENGNSKKTEFEDTIDVSAVVANQMQVYESSVLTGVVSAKVLQLNIERNSTGAGADTYGNDFDILGIELIKA